MAISVTWSTTIPSGTIVWGESKTTRSYQYYNGGLKSGTVYVIFTIGRVYGTNNIVIDAHVKGTVNADFTQQLLAQPRWRVNGTSIWTASGIDTKGTYHNSTTTGKPHTYDVGHQYALITGVTTETVYDLGFSKNPQNYMVTLDAGKSPTRVNAMQEDGWVIADMVYVYTQDDGWMPAQAVHVKDENGWGR